MKVTIVDTNDKAIGQKPFDSLTNDDIYRVSALWVTNFDGQILLAQRQLGKRNDPGKWGPAVSGTVEDGETYEDNIYKEAAEEIGLSGVNFVLGPKVFNSFGPHKFFVQWYLCRLDRSIENFKIQEEEVAQVAWIGKSELVRQLGENPNKFTAGASNIWKDLLDL